MVASGDAGIPGFISSLIFLTFCRLLACFSLIVLAFSSSLSVMSIASSFYWAFFSLRVLRYSLCFFNAQLLLTRVSQRHSHCSLRLSTGTTFMIGLIPRFSFGSTRDKKGTGPILRKLQSCLPFWHLLGAELKRSVAQHHSFIVANALFTPVWLIAGLWRLLADQQLLRHILKYIQYTIISVPLAKPSLLFQEV